MPTTPFESQSEKGTETWDQLYEALAAEPRRLIVFSLMNEPADERLALPDAAQSPNQPTDPESLRLRLRHHHLPKLADAGYVRWESNPFCVERGPHFEEPALVLRKMTDCGVEYPDRLREECIVIGEIAENTPD